MARLASLPHRSLTANEVGANPLSAVLHFVRKTAGVTFAASGALCDGIGRIAGVAAWTWALNDCRVPVGRKSRAEERVRTRGRRGEVGSGQGRMRRGQSRGNHATYPGMSEAKWSVGR